jgi:endonuclease-3
MSTSHVSPDHIPKARKRARATVPQADDKKTRPVGRKLPFADFPHPSAEQCAHAVDALSALHGRPKRKAPRQKATGIEAAACGDVPHVLDALVHTILSQNTTNANSTRAMANLLARFKNDWHAVWKADLHDVSAAIACGGLGNVKGRRIKTILDSVLERYGDLTLDHMHDLSDVDAEKELLTFSGVGPKTASCVLLFCLGRDSFAVDTHVWRIAKSLGWVPRHATREQAFLHLDSRVPQPLKYPLHVLLVRHGKHCIRCAANHRPQFTPLGPCPLEPVAAH